MQVRAKSAAVRNAADWWLILWGWNMVALIVGAYYLPFRYWVLWAIAGFGSMEAVGLWSQKHTDKYPPLTDVIRCYVPRWAALGTMWALLVSAAAGWGISWRSPWQVGLLFGVIGWLTDHFEHRYDGPAND